MPPYFNLNYKIHAQNNNQFCSTPTKFNTQQNQSNLVWHSSGPLGNLVSIKVLKIKGYPVVEKKHQENDDEPILKEKKMWIKTS